MVNFSLCPGLVASNSQPLLNGKGYVNCTVFTSESHRKPIREDYDRMELLISDGCSIDSYDWFRWKFVDMS